MPTNILMTGNGFDLYHHLPTRYTDFLEFANNWNSFKQKYEKNDNLDDYTNTFKIRLSDKHKLNKDTIDDFAKNSFDTENLKYLDRYITSNFWIRYFNSIGFHKDGWIDFEKEIEKSLISIENFYTKIYTANENLDKELFINIEPVLKELNIVDKDFYVPYLDMEDSVVFNDGVFDIVSNSIIPSWLKNQKTIIISYLKKELNILVNCLNIYLTDFISRVECDVFSEQIKNIGNCYLLNFNYTRTYELNYEIPDDNKNSNAKVEKQYIHGEIGKELVLGVSDDAFADSLDFIYFQKYFQRIQKHMNSNYKKWLEYGNNKLFIVGHSLDRTDASIIKELFESENVESITIFYHEQSVYETQVINLVGIFGRKYIINQYETGRIKFVKLQSPVNKVY